MIQDCLLYDSAYNIYTCMCQLFYSNVFCGENIMAGTIWGFYSFYRASNHTGCMSTDSSSLSTSSLLPTSSSRSLLASLLPAACSISSCRSKSL